MNTDCVTSLLNDIRLMDEQQFKLVQAVRELVLGLDDGVAEQVKYGGLLFSSSKPFCGIFAYSQHVSLEFGDGASLADDYQVLEGKGKLRRHIKLASQADISAKQVPHYLKLAYQLTQS